MSSVVSNNHLFRPLIPVAETLAGLLFCSELMMVGGWGDIRVASHGESPIQTKWRDQALWGCHFLTPLKVIQLFLLVKRFCFLTKPVLVIGICQYEWIYCVPTAAEAQTHAPHMAATGAGGGPADNRDPRNCTQALRLETGC